MTDTSASHLEPSTASFVEYEQIILFGDSITQGSCSQQEGFAFMPALQHDYVRKFDVINRGFNGYTSQQGLEILPSFFPSPQKAKVRLMTIFFGANDAVLPPFQQHVPLPLYKIGLSKILTHPLIQNHHPETRLLLLTPPPINEYQLEPAAAAETQSAPAPAPVIRKADTTKQYAEACRDVGRELGVPVVDTWAAFMKEAGWEEGEPLAGSKRAPANVRLGELLSDGLHFSPEGYRVMYREVMKVIRACYPELAPEKVPMRFPGWEKAPTGVL
ncbi:hypothetical protein PAAG_02211 [Paracoccidioides lutzii Pb01]|uniref:SGNH hydrolase-type esterase domain-containing protein n=1 Tax=Paracoccidioides lutzii (strain ATCC MYA-826 / Pb01) TaxID=502779 RepID=C1GVD4_PARBA|nr:hypothetical protein PAAG_02211 [Paracoccidioides lutzii Pb01]EEH40156.2 hypothetical protein PAAG_02211 [Paracoccidioides lutzii Pb01]